MKPLTPEMLAGLHADVLVIEQALTRIKGTLAVVSGSVATHLVGIAKCGSKIDAIKTVRSFTGLGLREAKDAVDGVEAGRPFYIGCADTAGFALALARLGCDLDSPQPSLPSNPLAPTPYADPGFKGGQRIRELIEAGKRREGGAS